MAAHVLDRRREGPDPYRVTLGAGSFPQDPTEVAGDPSEQVRSLFASAGFEELAFVRPDDASYRVGVHRWPGPGTPYEPDVRMFAFV